MQNRKTNREKGHLINDPTLLKIHRIYEHDEAVKILEAEVSKLNKEIGILKSEKSQLEDENTKFKILLSAIPESVILAVGGIPMTIDENPRIPQKIKKELRKLREDAKEWRDKYFQAIHQNSIVKQS